MRTQLWLITLQDEIIIVELKHPIRQFIAHIHIKAFDSTPHGQLLQLLADIGISDQLLRWFANYLTGRYQQVVLDEFSSTYQPVTSGVPQGSILGPLLYIIFTKYIQDPTIFQSQAGARYMRMISSFTSQLTPRRTADNSRTM